MRCTDTEVRHLTLPDARILYGLGFYRMIVEKLAIKDGLVHEDENSSINNPLI